MSITENQLRNAISLKKDVLIEKLIQRGIYKKDHTQLYDLTLADLEKEYAMVIQQEATQLS